MSCNCIPNGKFEVSNIEDAAQQPLEKNIEPWLEKIHKELCVWAKPTVSQYGEEAEKTLWKVALVAIATINSLAQYKIADMQYEIGKDYYRIAEEQWKRFRDRFAPLERVMLTEAGNTPIPVPNYDKAKSRATSSAAMAFRDADEYIADLAKKYALCMDAGLLDDLDYARTISQDDGVNFNYRDEEFWINYKDDQRWNRRSELLNYGRDIYSTSSSYASAANSALTSLGSLVNAGAQGATKMLGYLSTKNETLYPALFSGVSPISGTTMQNLGGTSVAMGPWGA